MTKEKAEQLLVAVAELKEIKVKLMNWSNAIGYNLDGQVEAYLRGISEVSDETTLSK